MTACSSGHCSSASGRAADCCVRPRATLRGLLSLTSPGDELLDPLVGRAQEPGCSTAVRGVDASLYEPDAQSNLKHHWERDRDGVVYRANPTNSGVSQHGFPEHPDRFPGKGNAS